MISRDLKVVSTILTYLGANPLLHCPEVEDVTVLSELSCVPKTTNMIVISLSRSVDENVLDPENALVVFVVVIEGNPKTEALAESKLFDCCEERATMVVVV